VANKPKKKFDEKWQYLNGEWNGKWQTEKQMDVPENLPPYMDNMRLWACEMSEWAVQVNKQLGDLIAEVEGLKQSTGGYGGTPG
jgi:hypothetical protein